MKDAAFTGRVLRFFRRHGRHDLPWRQASNPYRVLVSEVMLQQTQVDRVIPKFRAFLGAFPSFRALAHAKPSDVLRAWQGLGYNRRALMLQRCARSVVQDCHGRLPREFSALRALPGIGPYTAGAVMAFAFDTPHPVIETNIRRVYLHHFFPRRRNVPDSQILPLVMGHLASVISPREWYSALMDYGAYLGRKSRKEGLGTANPNRRSAHYARQSRFEGSSRQLRGRTLRHLLEHGPQTATALASALNDTRVPSVLAMLMSEGFVHKVRGKWHIL